MTEAQRGWRAIPPAILAGLVFEVVTQVIRPFEFRGEMPSARLLAITAGTSFAADVLLAFGCLELARRLSGRASRGVTIAAAGFGVLIAMHLVGTGTMMFASRHENIWKIAQYSWFFGFLASGVGLAIAARERPALAVAGVVVVLLASPPPFLQDKLQFSGTAGLTFASLCHVLRAAVSLAMVWIVAVPGTPDPSHAIGGFRRAGRALWLRVIAAIAVSGLTVMVVATGRSNGAMSTVKLTMISAAVINLIAMVQFGVGVLGLVRAGLADLGPWGGLAVSAASLWSAGAMLYQFSFLYQVLYGDDGGFGSRITRESAEALSTAMPIIASASIGFVAVVVHRYARARGLRELARAATSKGTTFALLMLATIAVQTWFLVHVRSAGSFVLLTLAAAIAGLAANVTMARLCTLAATAIEDQGTLPVATASDAV